MEIFKIAALLKLIFSLAVSHKVSSDATKSKNCTLEDVSSFDRVYPTMVPTAKSRKLKWKLSSKKSNACKNSKKNIANNSKIYFAKIDIVNRKKDISSKKGKTHKRKHLTHEDNYFKHVGHKRQDLWEKMNYEFKVPNVANPFGNGNMPLQHDAQMKENSKYLDLLQKDFQKQLDIFNQDIIDQQPASQEDLEKSNSSEPARLPDEELERLVPQNQLKLENTTNILDHVLQKSYEISKQKTPEKRHRKKTILKGRKNSSFMKTRDLISNMNVKGNMDQLKLLMSEMQQTIDSANNALQEKQKKDQEDELKKEEEEKNKNKNNNKE